MVCVDHYAHKTNVEHRTSVEFPSPTNLPKIVGKLAWSNTADDTYEIAAIGHQPIIQHRGREVQG